MSIMRIHNGWIYFNYSPKTYKAISFYFVQQILASDGVSGTTYTNSGFSGLMCDKDYSNLYTENSLITLRDLNNYTVTNSGGTSAAPSTGMIYLNTTDNHFYGYNGFSWVQLDN